MALLLSRGRRPSLKWRPTQFEQGASKTMPAPYGGINLRTDITALKPNEARALENWIAESGYLSMRSGTTEHGTGLGGGEVKTLAAFSGLTAQKLVAGAGGKLFDVTTAGSGSQIATGFTQNRWQTALYNNRLILVNGADTPQAYTGASIGTAGFTGSGLTVTNLVNVALVRNRLWFCEAGSADVWYAGIGAITGAMTKFQLSQIASGGTCMAIDSWRSRRMA